MGQICKITWKIGGSWEEDYVRNARNNFRYQLL